jgi:Chitin binding Peritrophin-A domain
VRIYTETPIVIGACLHLNGIFEDPIRGCNHFYECIDGLANSHTCVEGLVFDSNLRKCRQTTAEEAAKCFAFAINPVMTPPLVDFAVAPAPGIYNFLSRTKYLW